MNEPVLEQIAILTTPERTILDVPQGLDNSMAILSLIVWYVSSGATLFTNKYILSYFDGDAFSLGTNQLIFSVIAGYIQIQWTKINSSVHQRTPMRIQQILRDMLFIGICRFITVILGLIAIKYIAVSLVATIKSSSPLFTVIISRIILREKTNYWTKLSMIPITIGLALCCSFDLSFHFVGFICALGTNIFDCLQNVYSKVLISGEKYRYTAIELQFWASFIACFVQLPLLFYNVDVSSELQSTSQSLILLYLFNGFVYHIQSVAAYAVMAYISPITHSVANTVKRAVLIWLSVLLFHNPVTFLSGFGTFIVICGVIFYNKARDVEKPKTIFSHNNSTTKTWRVV